MMVRLVRIAALIWCAALMIGPHAASADHGLPLRTEGWSPLTTALVFGGLALLAGMLVVVIVALLTRRNS